jgi:hypothetical protein
VFLPLDARSAPHAWGYLPTFLTTLAAIRHNARGLETKHGHLAGTTSVN